MGSSFVPNKASARSARPHRLLRNRTRNFHYDYDIAARKVHFASSVMFTRFTFLIMELSIRQIDLPLVTNILVVTLPLVPCKGCRRCCTGRHFPDNESRQSLRGSHNGSLHRKWVDILRHSGRAALGKHHRPSRNRHLP